MWLWSDGLTYNYSEEDGGYIVTGLDPETFTGTELIIPDYYNDGTNGSYPVVAIGESAFNGEAEDEEVAKNSALTSVVIGNNVKTIGSAAFANNWYDSEDITVTIPASVTKFEEGAFSNDASFHVNFLGTIDDWVQIEFEFEGNPLSEGGVEFCLNGELVTEINIQKATKVKASVFEYFYGTHITSIIIGDQVKSIGAGAFTINGGIKNIRIGNNVETIENQAFRSYDEMNYNEYDMAYYLGNEHNPFLYLVKCKSNDITACKINDKCRFISNHAFFNCGDLACVTIPNSVKIIGTMAFASCNKLNKFNYTGTQEEWNCISFSDNWIYGDNYTINYNYKED